MELAVTCVTVPADTEEAPCASVPCPPPAAEESVGVGVIGCDALAAVSVGVGVIGCDALAEASVGVGVIGCGVTEEA